LKGKSSDCCIFIFSLLVLQTGVFYYCTMERVCRQVRQKALILADIQAFVQRRLEEDERRKNDIEELEEEMET